MSASVILGFVLSCAQPHVDPKTGDVSDGVAACAPAGGPKPDVPVQPAPAPEPEKPPVTAKAPEGAHRDQPGPGTASNDKPRDPPAG